MHEIEYIGGGPPRERSSLGPARVWVVLGIVAVAAVVFMQWFSGQLFGATMAKAPDAIAHNEDVEGGQYSAFAMESKAMVKLRWVNMSQEERDAIAEDFKTYIVPLAVSRVERLRLATVAGELIGKDDALVRLTELQKELDPAADLAADVAWMKRLYESGPEKLADEVQASLRDRHGWFGDLALAFGRPMQDPIRRRAVAGRETILSTFKNLNRLQVALFLIGALALALMATNHAALQAEGQFDEAVPDEHLQAFVLFAAGFVVILGLSLLPFGLGAEGSLGATVASSLIIWTLLLIPLWPLIRGVRWTEFARTVGLHTGGGLPREVIIGAGAFLAWMPITIGMTQAMAALQLFFGSPSFEDSPSGHPLFQSPPSDSGLLLFLGILSSVVWAPIIEEIVFRGFLYGWLRERLGYVLAIVISSIAFGIVHPYSPLGMLEVGAAGVMFAILREWRGSLIAPMVAHALHNGTIEATSLAIAKAIGG